MDSKELRWLGFPVVLVFVVSAGMLYLAATMPRAIQSKSSKEHVRRVIARIEEGNLPLSPKQCAHVLKASSDYSDATDNLLAGTPPLFFRMGLAMLVAVLAQTRAIWLLRKKGARG